MNSLRAGLLLMLALLATLALPWRASAAECVPIRVGYMDQNRPPYWLGEGDKVPDPPGAAVDLIRDAVQGSGFGPCMPTWVRLPVARIRLALANGDIDLAPLGELSYYPAEIALPRDKAGNIDLARALHNQVLVLVRSKDKLPASTQPMQYFKGKTLGITQGNSYAPRLREAGLTLDDGARDLDRNIEKLKLGRVDGVVVAAVAPAHLKQTLAKYKGEIEQLPQPLLNIRVWLAFNDAYYHAHPKQCEALWTWLDQHRSRLGYVMQKYRKND
ncbi:hypothetical protein GJ699_05580 [Duganella sp. FT80W]|uniref:Transporter substrate-binding domain-containing protein n=1 Tax=Duganella guangzhouensis TaxID=2666084 RepID=A0A6I2KUA9_9BURK|nr:transporter substrate-binding domain-containing protein [Duganella guangzhouensis]MRW89448.1 hypothetical protein [Duganella guangzhouensis]